MPAPASAAGSAVPVAPHRVPLLWIAAIAPARDAAWAARHTPWLGASEAARLERIQRPERRAQFLAGHVLVRHLIGAVAGLDPSAVAIETSADGRPQVAAPAGWRASLAHSGGFVAALVDRAGAAEPGVDLERHKPGRDILAIVAAACGVQATSEDHAYRLWAQREAEFKAGPGTDGEGSGESGGAGAGTTWTATWHGHGLAIRASALPPTVFFALDGEAPPCEVALSWERMAPLGG